jgi:hypothetical protein
MTVHGWDGLGVEAKMNITNLRRVLLATAFALAGCGGGGDYGVASMPPPPVTSTPTPTPAIIPAATTSQQFTAVGVSHDWDSGQPLLGAGDQLQVRYVQSSNSYEVQLPHSETWEAIHPSPGNSTIYEGALLLTVRQPGYQYSNVLSWGDGASYYGTDAIGAATPASGVPVAGIAIYSGNLWGLSSETYSARPVTMFGGVDLSFDFGLGTLSGKVLPLLYYYATDEDYSLGPVNFRDTVYSAGSTTFSGKFDTNLTGVNSFTGLLTGPNAQELIGNFALPYKSPMDGQIYQSDGAFDAKR